MPEHVLLLDFLPYQAFAAHGGHDLLRPFDISLVTNTHTLKSFVSSQLSENLQYCSVTDLRSDQAVRSMVRAIAAVRSIDRIVAISEQMILPAARLRDELHIKGQGEADALVIRDKVIMKAAMRKGIRTPDNMRIANATEAMPLLERYGKIVLKPARSFGAIGVHVIGHVDQLLALPDLREIVDDAWEAEEFIAGAQLTVNSAVSDGRVMAAVASEYLEDVLAYKSGGIRGSVTLAAGERNDRVLSFNDRVVESLGSFTGVTHLELFESPDGELVFGEIAGRPPGGGLRPVFRHRFGAEMLDIALRAQLGLEVTQPTIVSAEVVGEVDLYGPAGILEKFESPLLSQDWVVDVARRKNIGDRIDKPLFSADASCIVTLVGPTQETVRTRMLSVMESTKFFVREEP